MDECSGCGKHHHEWLARAAGEEQWQPMCGAHWASAEHVAATYALRRDAGEEAGGDLTGPLAVLRGSLGVVEVRKAGAEGPITTWGIYCQHRMQYGAAPIDTWEEEIKLGRTQLWPFTSPSRVQFPGSERGE